MKLHVNSLVLFGLFCLILFFPIPMNAYNNGKTDSRIINSLNDDGTSRVFVYVKNNLTRDLLSLKDRKEFHRDFISRVHELEDSVIRNLSQTDIQIIGKLELYPAFSAFINNKSLLELENNILVERIEYDEIVMHKLSLSDNTNFLNVNELWNIGYNGSGQVICVLDSGINYSHPNLGNCNAVSNISDGSCPTIIGGHNFCANESCTSENENPLDNDGHGTSVAGILISNDSVQRGITFGSKLVIVKIINSTGEAPPGTLARGIDWCINNSISRNYNTTIFTISVGSPLNGTACDDISSSIQVNRAVFNNIFVSAGSGNNGNYTSIYSPSCASNATSVGASYNLLDNQFSECTRYNNSNTSQCIETCIDYNITPDKITCYSNRNSKLDLLAPSEDVTSTYIYGNFSSFGGTSGATPHVAGVAALMLQAANLSNISLTPAQIETTMKRTGVPIYDSATGLTFPRIDAYKAVMAVLYDVFVSDLRESYSDSQGRKVFEFNIFNDFPSTVTLNWSLDTGDGNILKSGNFTMNPMSQNNNTLVTVDYTYSNIGTFNVTASVFSSNGTTRNQTIEVSVTKPNVRILNQSIAFASGTRRVFTFLVQNNASVSYSNITWQLNSTGASNLPINSTTDVTLAAGELMSVFVDYIYNQSGQHNVTITADYLNVHSEFDENNTVTIFDWA